MQERRNSIANALELRLSYINPSISGLVVYPLSMLINGHLDTGETMEPWDSGILNW